MESLLQEPPEPAGPQNSDPPASVRVQTPSGLVVVPSLKAGCDLPQPGLIPSPQRGAKKEAKLPVKREVGEPKPKAVSQKDGVAERIEKPTASLQGVGQIVSGTCRDRMKMNEI